MPTNDALQAADRLSAYWDALVRDEPLTDEAADPALVATVQELLALDDTPGPTPDFRQRLWQELSAPDGHRVAAPSAPVISDRTAEAERSPMPSPDQGTSLTDIVRPRQWLRQIGQMSAAAVVVLLLTGLLVAVLRDRGGNSDATLPGVGSPCIPSTPPATASSDQLAFVGAQSGATEIYLIHSSGSDLRQLTEHAWVGGNDQGRALDRAGRPTGEELRPAWSPDGTRLAFTSDRDGQFDIWAIDADSGNLRRLTTEGDRNRWPVWSPDGSQIAFLSHRVGEDQIAATEIWVIRCDGAQPRQITTHSGVDFTSAPSWSPDGTQLVYSGNLPNGDAALFITHVDGSGTRQVSPEGIQAFDPSWSPDGCSILFAGETEGRTQIFTIDPDGSNLRQLTESQADSVAPAWSPDGTQIAFARTPSLAEATHTVSELLVMEADGGNVRSLATLDRVKLQAPVWSPDGKQIAFVAYHNDATVPTEGTWKLHVVDLSDSGLRTLTDQVAAGGSWPVWRPAPSATIPPSAKTPDRGPSVPFSSEFHEAEALYLRMGIHIGDASGEIEVWIDRPRDEAVMHTSDSDGMRSISVRRHLTLIEYLEMPGSVKMDIRRALSPDDPRLNQFATGLFGFPDLIEQGGAVVEGETSFHGQPALKIRMTKSPDSPMVVYLDPENLLPLGWATPGSDVEIRYSYEVIEIRKSGEIPAEVFEIDESSVTSRSFSTALSLEDAADFTAYPIWTLGPAFDDYHLRDFDHYATESLHHTMQTDRVTAVYVPAQETTGTAESEDFIQIISTGPLSDFELQTREAAKSKPPSEPVTVAGQPATLQWDSLYWTVEIRHEDGTVSVTATSRDLALAAAEALQRSNP